MKPPLTYQQKLAKKKEADERAIVFKTMPISTNGLYANFGNRRIKTKRGRDNSDAIGWEARAQHKGPPLDGPVRLKIALWWPTRGNHDIDNIKVLLDSCTGILWLDDGQITDLHLTKGYDKENPRVEMRYLLTPPHPSLT